MINNGGIVKSKTKEYKIWSQMLQRCLNPNDSHYRRYGGRGISVDMRWRSFDVFIQDMGYRPSSSHTLDRIDNNGNYTKENCRWATIFIQANNSSANHRITAFGITKTLAEWSRDPRCVVGYSTLAMRIWRGLDPVTAITRPKRHLAL